MLLGLNNRQWFKKLINVGSKSGEFLRGNKPFQNCKELLKRELEEQWATLKREWECALKQCSKEQKNKTLKGLNKGNKSDLTIRFLLISYCTFLFFLSHFLKIYIYFSPILIEKFSLISLLSIQYTGSTRFPLLVYMEKIIIINL